MLALIFDFDNTIYPVSSIGDQLFPPLFAILGRQEFGLNEDTLKKAKNEIQRRPFQKVADEFNFPPKLVEESLDLLRGLTYTGSIKPFDDYERVRRIPALRFLVTTGFYKLQNSKIEKMEIKGDFQEIFIIDPDESAKTKKDVFQEILSKYQLNPLKTIIVGDDAESEIRAAQELGLKSFLLDPSGAHSPEVATFKGGRLHDLLTFLEEEELLEIDRSEDFKGN